MNITIDGINRDQYVEAEQALMWLADHGALAGVAEILLERKRQISIGHTPEGDQVAIRSELVHLASRKLRDMMLGIRLGTIGYPESEAALKQAAALCAAEIDRLNTMIGDGNGKD